MWVFTPLLSTLISQKKTVFEHHKYSKWPLIMKLAHNQERHKISNKFKIWPDPIYLPKSSIP